MYVFKIDTDRSASKMVEGNILASLFTELHIYIHAFIENDMLISGFVLTKL